MRAKTWLSRKRIGLQFGRWALIAILVVSPATEYAPRAMAQGTPVRLEVERGQVITLVLSSGVDSESSKVGDRVELKLAQPLVVGTQTVLPAGWLVPAHITKVRRAGNRNCRSGAVAWKLDALTAPDGMKVKLVSLRGVPCGACGSNRARVPTAGQKFGKVAKDVVIAPIFAVELPFVLLEGLAMAVSEGEPCRAQPGAPADIPIGTTRYAAVAQDVRMRVYQATN